MDVLPNELKKDWSKELTVKKETHYAVEESHGLCVGQDYPMAKIEVELDVQRFEDVLLHGQCFSPLHKAHHFDLL
jgi:hypothetical protein